MSEIIVRLWPLSALLVLLMVLVLVAHEVNYHD